MDRNNTKTAIANEPREEIDADFAVGMVRDGFHVFIDNTDEPLTYDMVFGSKDPFDFDNETHVLTAPMMEVAQENALESLCSRFDILHDESRYTGGMSLEVYADELYDEHDDESQYRWRDSLSEWENIRVSILSDKTKYLQRFLNDVSLSYPSKAAELRKDLDDYAADYLNRNKVEQSKTTNADLPAKRKESRGSDMDKDKQVQTLYQVPNKYGYNMVDLFVSAVDKNGNIVYANFDVGLDKNEEVPDIVKAFKDGKMEVKDGYIDWNDSDQYQWFPKYMIDQMMNGKMLKPIAEYGENVIAPPKKQAEHIPQQDISHNLTNADLSATRGEREMAMDMPLISVSKESGTNKPFDVTSVGLETDRKYTVAEFNEAIKKSNEIWRNNWDGFGDPKNIAIVTIDNLHKVPCTYRVNLAEEYNSIQDIVNFNPFPPYLSPQDAVKDPIEVLNKAEAMSKNNADLSATRGERQVNMANTKMECTGMVMLAEDSKAKAVANVTVNDEFVIKGIKVYDGANGLFASMPSRKIGGEYQDIVFPITKEAREQINNAVLETYGKLAESGLDKLPLEEKAPPEKSASKITVSLHQIDDEKTKAVGQIVIDDSIVVSGVKVRHGTNTQGEEKDFVSMPSYQTQTGEYNEYAHAITKDCRDKINKAVLGAYETLSKTEYKGVKFSELGNKADISSKYGMNNQFAQKLMGELDKANIPYSARVAETTSLSVKNADKATVDKIQKDLTAALNKQPEQHQSKPKTR